VCDLNIQVNADRYRVLNELRQYVNQFLCIQVSRIPPCNRATIPPIICARQACTSIICARQVCTYSGMGVLNLDPSALNVALTATAAHIQAYREYSTVETIVIIKFPRSGLLRSVSEPDQLKRRLAASKDPPGETAVTAP
jgi:hypothetical protein